MFDWYITTEIHRQEAEQRNKRAARFGWITNRKNDKGRKSKAKRTSQF